MTSDYNIIILRTSNNDIINLGPPEDDIILRTSNDDVIIIRSSEVFCLFSKYVKIVELQIK